MREMYLNDNKGENKDYVKLKDIKEDCRGIDIPKLSMKYIF